VLTIAAGATLKFDAGCDLEIGYSDPGGLVAVGTSGNEITFTANTPTPTKGFWDGVFFYNSAVTSNLTYCIVEYAGTTPADGTYDGNITIADNASSTVTITNSIIRNSNSWGVVRYWATYGGEPDYTAGAHNNTFSNNGTSGTRHQSTPW